MPANFLTVLSGDQVCTLHSIGRFRCDIGKHTPAHNHIFWLLGGNVGDKLPPIVILPEAGLVPWLQPEERYQIIATDLEVLEISQKITVTEPVVTGDANDRPKFSVQKLVVIPKAWTPYLMDTLSPWGALQEVAGRHPRGPKEIF